MCARWRTVRHRHGHRYANWRCIMAKGVTIKDVAAEAGVSFKTVSNVINGTGSMRESTRERVLAAMDKLNYAINLSARSLKTGTTGLLGLAVFDFSQPFASYLADQVIDYAREYHYGVIINTYGQAEHGLARAMQQANNLAADGWIVFADHALGQHGKLLEQNYPLVLAGDWSAYGKVDWVTMPNVDAMRYATNRLLDAGCRSIALFGADGTLGAEHYRNATEGTQELRVQGYMQAYEEHGFEADMRMLFSWGLLMSDSGVHAVDLMLEEGSLPDAIICLNDAMALGALHQLQVRGVRVPDDVQVVGFDNVPETKYANPSLTTIDPHLGSYVRHAVDMLIERIQGHDGPTRVYTSDFTLVERASTRL